MYKILKCLLMALLISSSLQAAVVGKVVPDLNLTGDDGGFVDNRPFYFKNLRGKIFVIMFADPDEKGEGEILNETLNKAKENFPDNTMQSIALINLKATWKPNWIINKILKSKQKKFPNAWFVKDVNGKMMREWGLKDDAYECLIINENGILIKYETAPFDQAKVDEIIDAIESEVYRLAKERE